jgi:transposase InsO family protein
MPWKVSSPVRERMLFVSRLEQGERMTDLCAEFGVSRKTGHKIWDRYNRKGPAGLEDESRAPRRIANRTSPAIVEKLVELRKKHPTWGGRKIRDWLVDNRVSGQWPAPSTMTEIFRRNGLIDPNGRRSLSQRRKPGMPWSNLAQAEQPNDVWCVDYKGQFRLGNREYCYPLTTSDLFSRFLLTVESLDGTDEEQARPVFEEAFREYGLPLFIRSDNGPPFASKGLLGWTRLSVWWMRLGIVHQRIEPGHPEQNPQHERMHRTLKAETTRPAGENSLQQQERFDGFKDEYNNDRPHEALGGTTPGRIYQPSSRRYPDTLPEPTYPFHDDVLLVDSGGHIRLPLSRKIFVSAALLGQLVGLRERDDGLWVVTFLDQDLGLYDPRQGVFKPNS